MTDFLYQDSILKNIEIYSQIKFELLERYGTFLRLIFLKIMSSRVLKFGYIVVPAF